MKKTLLYSGCVAAAALLTAGCGPDLAQGGYGAEEQQWQKAISDSYSGYRPPRIAPPAIVDKAAPEALEKQRGQQESAGAPKEEETDSVSEVPAPGGDGKQDVKAADTPARTVDSVADKTSSAAPESKADGGKPDVQAGPAGLDSEIYVVKSGDSLGGIAKKFYGQASHYELIMKANPQIKNPGQIQIGTKLRIPKL